VSIVTTSSKGQVALPKKEREKLGIKPGAKVIVKAASDHIKIYPLPENPVEYFCGIFEEGSSLTHALLKERKEEAKRERKKGAGLLPPSGLSEKGR
jgi:AbrB family looped-hinge helix DNA binding protein